MKDVSFGVGDICAFTPDDAAKIAPLFRVSSHVLRTAELLDTQNAMNAKLAALLSLTSDVFAAQQRHDFKQLVRSICTHSHDLFDCDRCTFFIVDQYSETVDSDGSSNNKYHCDNRHLDCRILKIIERQVNQTYDVNK